MRILLLKAAGAVQSVPVIVRGTARADGTVTAPHASWRRVRAPTPGAPPPLLPSEIEGAAEKTDTSPTPAQAKAGNYAQGRVALHGMDIAIETPRGATRSGTAPDGTPWAIVMPEHYGRIRGTRGADGDEVDVYLGPRAEEAGLPVYIVDQMEPEAGTFDEHKILLGFGSEAEALRVYDAGFSDGTGPKRRGAITAMSLDDLRQWLARDRLSTGPVDPLAFYRTIIAREPAAAAPPDADAEPQGDTAAEAQPTAPELVLPASWGMPPGATAEDRIEANRAAIAELDVHRAAPAEVTAEAAQVLSAYTGWGGIWPGIASDDFQTPIDLASAAWALVQKLGFVGGAVLEPAAGTGTFQAAAPGGAAITAVEFRPESAAINRLIFGPRDQVIEGPFEQFAVNDGRIFDLAIGMPPFGDRDAFAPLDPARAHLGTAERYFVDAALDKLRDGGLLAFLLPSSLLDATDEGDFRPRMIARAQLLTAFRLPCTAFAASGLDMTVDLLVLRKRPAVIGKAMAALPLERLATLPCWWPALAEGWYMTQGAGAAHVLGSPDPEWSRTAELGGRVLGSMAGVADHIRDWQPAEGIPADDTPTIGAVLDAAGPDAAAVLQALGMPA